MRWKSHATLTAHGFTKSFRKTHLVALSLIQAKAYAALAVLSCSLLPSASYLYRAFNAEDQPFMNTYLQHCRTIHRYLFPVTSSKALREAQTQRGRTHKSQQKEGKKAHKFVYVLLIQDTPSVHTNNLATLAFSLLVCVIVVIVRKHLHFQYYERRPLTRLNVKPNLWSSLQQRVLLLPQFRHADPSKVHHDHAGR